MAKETRPEYFYHPVMGAYSPMTLGMRMGHLFQQSSSSSPQPTPYVRTPMTLSRTAECAVTEEILPQSQMIKFVVAPDGYIVADMNNKLPGVFLWVKAERAVLKKAIWRNSFAAKTRQAVKIHDNLLETIENSLFQQAMQTLSLAKRAGELRFGFTKADEALRSHTAAVYVVAKDAKENGREKLERLAQHDNAPVLDLWTSAELSKAIGEANINHIVLAHGGLTQKLLEIVTKLKAVKSE